MVGFTWFEEKNWKLNLHRPPLPGSGIHSCTSCNEFLTLDGGMCLECSAGRYYNSSLRACVPCDSSCLTCNAKGATSCTSCQSPLSLHPATRTCRLCCPPGIADETINHCCLCNPDTGKLVQTNYFYFGKYSFLIIRERKELT